MAQVPPAAASGFGAKEQAFYGTTPHQDDNVTTIQSPYGHFKIATYLNQGRAGDRHTVVFFHNTRSDRTFEVHGTIAREYLNSVRGRSNVIDVPIADHQTAKDNPTHRVAYFTRFAMRWDPATNAVITRWYQPWGENVKVARDLHKYDPVSKATLVAYSEEHVIATPSLNFSNWKNEKISQYAPDIKERSVGEPTQILLHETAGWDMSIPNVENRGKSTPFYAVPHFCVNLSREDGVARVIQFVDIATQTSHGEVTNAWSIGIEFANPVFDDGTPTSKLKLTSSTRGIYFKTGLASLPRHYLPLDFASKPEPGFFELSIPKAARAGGSGQQHRARLLNEQALSTKAFSGKGPQIIDKPDHTVLQYVRSTQLEALETLVVALTKGGHVPAVPDPSVEGAWKHIIRQNGKLYAVFEHGWVPIPPPGRKPPPGKKPAPDPVQFFFDVAAAGIMTHAFIGGHADGRLQGLYLYLRLVRKVPAREALQLTINAIIRRRAPGPPTLTLTALFEQQRPGAPLATPNSPQTKTFQDAVELDDVEINRAAKQLP